MSKAGFAGKLVWLCFLMTGSHTWAQGEVQDASTAPSAPVAQDASAGQSSPAEQSAAPSLQLENRALSFAFVPGLSTNDSARSPVKNRFSLNVFLDRAHTLEGAEFSGVGAMRDGNVRGFQGSGVFNLTEGDLKGAQWAGTLNSVRGTAKGAQIAGVFNYIGAGKSGIDSLMKEDEEDREDEEQQYAFKGAQLSGVANVVAARFKGMQAAGVANVTTGRSKGAMLAGVVNVQRERQKGFQGAGIVNYAKEIKGAQLAGIVNIADEVRGAQIAGIINNAAEPVRGVQIGLVNIAPNSDFSLGLINVMTQGRLHALASADETGFVHVGLKHGGRYWHNSYSFSYRATGTDYRYGLNLGLGAHLPVKDRWYVDLDLLTGSFFDEQFSFEKPDQLHRLQAVVGYKVLPKLSLFAGPALSLFTSFNHHDGNELAPSFDKVLKGGAAGENTVRQWPGLVLGIQGL